MRRPQTTGGGGAAPRKPATGDFIDDKVHTLGALNAPHRLHDRLVWSQRPPSSRIRRNQYDACIRTLDNAHNSQARGLESDAAGPLACARRRSDVTRCSGDAMTSLAAAVSAYLYV